MGKSKLEPFRELIRQLRIEDVTYRDIADRLKKDYNIDVNHTTILSFVKVRSKPRKAKYRML